MRKPGPAGLVLPQNDPYHSPCLPCLDITNYFLFLLNIHEQFRRTAQAKLVTILDTDEPGGLKVRENKGFTPASRSLSCLNSDFLRAPTNHDSQAFFSALNTLSVSLNDQPTNSYPSKLNSVGPFAWACCTSLYCICFSGNRP